MHEKKMIKIFRHEHTSDGTFGVLLVNGEIIAFTLERPWIGNEQNVSCIPPGLYHARKREDWFGAEKYGPTYQVENVQGRTGILFHVGNTIEDLQGCIAPGLAMGRMNDRKAVLNSGAAFRLFLKEMGNVGESPLLITSFEANPYQNF